MSRTTTTTPMAHEQDSLASNRARALLRELPEGGYIPVGFVRSRLVEAIKAINSITRTEAELETLKATRQNKEHVTDRARKSLGEKNLDSIRDLAAARVRRARDKYAQGEPLNPVHVEDLAEDMYALVAESRQLRLDVANAVTESRNMQDAFRASVTLVHLQHTLDDLLYPGEGDQS